MLPYCSRAAAGWLLFDPTAVVKAPRRYCGNEAGDTNALVSKNFGSWGWIFRKGIDECRARRRRGEGGTADAFL